MGGQIEVSKKEVQWSDQSWKVGTWLRPRLFYFKLGSEYSIIYHLVFLFSFPYFKTL